MKPTYTQSRVIVTESIGKCEPNPGRFDLSRAISAAATSKYGVAAFDLQAMMIIIFSLLSR